MLNFSKTETMIDGKPETVLVVSRIGFKVPNFIDPEKVDEFRGQVFGYADALHKKAYVANESNLLEDEFYSEKIDKYNELATMNVTPLAKATVCGLGWYKGSHKVSEEFTALYDTAVSYRERYLDDESGAWSDDRKTEFTIIREAMADVFNYYRSLECKPREDYELNISAKYVNLFVDSLVIAKAKKFGNSKTGKFVAGTVQHMPIDKAFNLYWLIVLMVSGCISYDLKKVKIYTDSF